MSSSNKLQGHPSLPAPVVHIGFTVPQSKSNVLAGVQDAYWSDDEADDAECPLCLEEMDISDLNFKPCVCGYQICRFCWHHIKENLNGRCPACRRVYTDDTVEFTAVNPEDHKKLTQQKKQRDRERRELEALGRRQLANVRVVQRNVVYVVGIGPRFAKEELIPTLRSQEYFGQYGKISKLLLTKRSTTGGGAPVVGLYITYHRREDAARAITAVDGTASPGGGKDIMRASYGTTKYCMAFLRGASCTDHNCMNLHEWGDEKDCFTKEDLTTLKHTMKATESRTARAGKESDSLPRSAAWANKNANFPPISASSSSNVRSNRRGGRAQAPRSAATVQSQELRSSPAKNQKTGVPPIKPASQASSSRPPTPSPAPAPAPPATPAAEAKVKPKKAALTQKPQAAPAQSPTPSVTAESDHGSIPPEAPPPPPPAVPPSVEGPPPGLPAVPPGLTPPPGLPAPPGLSMPPRVDSASPQTPILQSSYQMSNAARGLLDDLTARRQVSEPTIEPQTSPFPDLDHTLQILSGDNGSFGGFGFNLDPNMAVSEDELPPLPSVDLQAEAEAEIPFTGTFLDAFPALRTPNVPSSPFMSSPGIPYTHSPARAIYDPLAVRSSSIERQSTGGSSYMSSFNPFADSNDSLSSSPASIDDDRKVSRFGFARGHRGTNASASPVHAPSPLSTVNSDSIYAPSAVSQDISSTSSPSHWRQTRQEYGGYANVPSSNHSNVSSPLVPHGIPAQTPNQPVASTSRFQPFDNGNVTEAQLRDFIQSSQAASLSRLHAPDPPHHHQQSPYKPSAGYTQYNDPAIMSASFAQSPPPPHLSGYHHPIDASQLSYGPPPGLAGYPPPGLAGGDSNSGLKEVPSLDVNPVVIPAISANINPSKDEVSAPALSPSDFPALSAPSEATPSSDSIHEAIPPAGVKPNAKAERKAAKKAAAAEKAAERARISEEKAAARAAEKAEKARIAAVQEKAVKAAREKAVQEKAEKEKLEKERLDLEKAVQEKERAARAVRKQLQEERAAKEAEKAQERERLAAKKVKQQSETQGKANRQDIALDKPVAPRNEPNPTEPGPLLSKKPKKNKPVTKPIKVVREDSTISQPDESYTVPSTAASDVVGPGNKPGTATSSSNNSRAQSIERDGPISLQDLFDEVHIMNPQMDLPTHPFFDLTKINPEAEMPVEYAPLVHALSALSVGGGSSFANNIPTGSMDNAVTNFQQLLETLTNTISDLLHLLPRTTWDDNSSFNGSLQDMMKGEESLDVAGEEGSREDDVAALTLALERRARWMEVQLSKLEELHRDINTAAVRAVLSFNDHGWDRRGFLPHGHNALKRFDSIGYKFEEESGAARPMTSAELEKKLVVAKEAATFAEAELREVMERMQVMKPFEDM